MPRKLPKRELLDPKRARIRQSWHPFNIYNLQNLKPQYTSGTGITFFKQKWAAKAATRAYHGEQVPEHRWERLFSRYIPSVVPMDPKFLARTDGSDESAGRGSGLTGATHQDMLEKAADSKKEGVVKGRRETGGLTPHMHMTFWTLERRLDTAIHRALFASSIRQSRQMVIHGHVKVNGKKMIHPGYMLNPGDMFSVDVDTVLWATGRHSFTSGARTTSSEEVESSEDNIQAIEAAQDGDTLEGSATSVEVEEPDMSIEEDSNDPVAIKERKAALKSARKMIDNVIEKADPSAARKRELRELRKQINILVQNIKSEDSESNVSNLQGDLTNIISKIEQSNDKPESQGPSDDTQLSISRNSLRKNSSSITKDNHITALARSYSEILPNKSYEQPWVPRDWMAPFAFVPRYLEVNYTICSAVYLRHPVARPGMAEVPTPFGIETSSLAHNWYLRRR